MAARPRTLPAAVAPVLVGTALAATERHGLRWLAFVAALLGAVFIQVGTNLSNDYSDARRGADTEDRLGPVRVTAGGLVPPRQVLRATYVTFGLAVLCGVYLVVVAGWVLLLIGAASILAGVLYTGGPRPYGYEGLGEVFVFLFFGIVAVAGSYYVQTERLEWEAFVLAVPVGLLAAAILVVNNVRDLETDRRAGKRTLAVRLGRAAHARALRRDGLRGLPDRPGAVGGGLAVALAAAAVAHAAPRRLGGAPRAPAHRRSHAERGAGPHGPAPAPLLRPARGRPAPELTWTSTSPRSASPSTARCRSRGASCAERELLVLRLAGRDGVIGWGEAAPLEPYDGVSLGVVQDAFEAYEPILRSGDGAHGAELLDACREAADVPQALAAVDLALWDRAGNREGRLGQRSCSRRRRRGRSGSTRRSRRRTAPRRPRRPPPPRATASAA